MRPRFHKSTVKFPFDNPGDLFRLVVRNNDLDVSSIKWIKGEWKQKLSGGSRMFRGVQVLLSPKWVRLLSLLQSPTRFGCGQVFPKPNSSGSPVSRMVYSTIVWFYCHSRINVGHQSLRSCDYYVYCSPCIFLTDSETHLTTEDNVENWSVLTVGLVNRPLVWFHLLQNVNVTLCISCKTRQ